MCPLCLGTATLVLSGGGSAGGVTALVLRRLVRRARQRAAERAPLAPKAADAKRPAG